MLGMRCSVFITQAIQQGMVKNKFDFFVTLEAVTASGVYHLTDSFLKANDIEYVHYDDCFLKLTKQSVNLNVFCKPVIDVMFLILAKLSSSPEIKLF